MVPYAIITKKTYLQLIRFNYLQIKLTKQERSIVMKKPGYWPGFSFIGRFSE